MKCNNCGHENPENTKFCAECGQSLDVLGDKQRELDDFREAIQRQNRQRMKWWQVLLICLGALFLLTIIIDIFAENGDTNSKPSSNALSAGQAASKEKKKTFNAGETLDANGLKITMQKAEIWNSVNQFIEPGAGNIFMRAYFVIQNQSGSDKLIGGFDFDCYADGGKADMSLFGDNQLSFDTISDGRRIEGYIYYEIPKDAQNIEIEYETSWWRSEKAIFKVELAK